MSHWSRRSLCLWYPRALSGIRHRRWQYHREGHTGRRTREEKNNSVMERAILESVFGHHPPPPAHTHPLLKLWQTTNTVGSGYVHNLQWLQSQFLIRDITVICKRHAMLASCLKIFLKWISMNPNCGPREGDGAQHEVQEPQRGRKINLNNSWLAICLLVK